MRTSIAGVLMSFGVFASSAFAVPTNIDFGQFGDQVLGLSTTIEGVTFNGSAPIELAADSAFPGGLGIQGGLTLTGFGDSALIDSGETLEIVFGAGGATGVSLRAGGCVCGSPWVSVTGFDLLGASLGQIDMGSFGYIPMDFGGATLSRLLVTAEPSAGMLLANMTFEGVAAVPEPGSAALLALALIGVVMTRRRGQPRER